MTDVYEEMALDYGRLSAREFDAKYPGWAGSYQTLDALREAFDRKRDLEAEAEEATWD